MKTMARKKKFGLRMGTLSRQMSSLLAEIQKYGAMTASYSDRKGEPLKF